jgi:hypothetical protein
VIASGPKDNNTHAVRFGCGGKGKVLRPEVIKLALTQKFNQILEGFGRAEEPSVTVKRPEWQRPRDFSATG